MVQNVPPSRTWEALTVNPCSHLIDVRTEAEWAFVGVPDLTAAGKRTVLIQWQAYPSMQRDPAFEERLKQLGLTPDHHLYFICRSGVRSLAAAEAAVSAGFPHVYNVADGFEGPVDSNGHRGQAAGWKAEGLPWVQR